MKDVDVAKLRQCTESESIMCHPGYREGKGLDESKLSLTYCDVIRLRLLYDWQYSPETLPETLAQLAE